MTVLVGCAIPGLLSALEQSLGGTQRLTVLHEIEAIAALVRDPNRRIDALILSDALVPSASTDIATALWEVVSYVARERQPTIPTVFTLRDDTATTISEALRAEVQRIGGSLLLVPRGLHGAEQPEAQQIVSSILEHFAFEPQRRNYKLVAVGNAGGMGTTNALVNINLQFARLGLRVLLIDCEHGKSGVRPWLRIQPQSHESIAAVKEQNLAARIVHHESGVDVLFAPYTSDTHEDAVQPKIDELLDALQPLHYDVVSFDGLRDWQERPDVLALLVQPTTSPLVICPAGAKERTAALATLQALSTISRGNGHTALDTTMLLFVEGERGQVTQIDQVKRNVLHRYPIVTDLGTLPRDPALLSLLFEGKAFRSVFDLAPKRAYCHAIRRAVRLWTQAVELPTTWLIRPDSNEHPPQKRLWPLHRLRKAKSSKARARLPLPVVQHQEREAAPQEVQPDDRYPQVQESIVTMALRDVAQAVEGQPLHTDQQVQAPIPLEEPKPVSDIETSSQANTNTSWLDTARQHQRARVLRAPVPEKQD